MYKHRRSKSQRHVLKNQNRALDESASSAIMGLMDSLPGSDFKTDYLHSSFLSKFADPKPESSASRYKLALEKWLKTEEHNRATNERVRVTEMDFNILPRVTLRRFLRQCRKTVRMILSELTDEVLVGGFSGGASTSRRRTESHPSFKFSDKADVTEDAVFAVELLLRQVPLFREHSIFSILRIVEGAVLFTDRKSVV